MTGAPPPPVRLVHGVAWRQGDPQPGQRVVPEETPVAFSYNRLSFAVMMATPADLDDFAIGFSLAEQIIQTPSDIEELQSVVTESGVELRMWIAEPRMAQLNSRRRRIAGPTGCGLCGLESLADAVRPPPPVHSEARFAATALRQAMATLPDHQALNAQTRAVHAAAFWRPDAGIIAVREDVGRHNALDKLAGTLARAGIGAGDGVLLMTSRISVELVQKAALMGAPVILAVSAPTALALRVAEAAGVTIAAVARADGFEILTCPARITFGAPDGA